MSGIVTNENIKIEGVSYEHILFLKVQQEIGQHGTACLRLEVEESVGRSMTNRVFIDYFVKIITTQGDRADVLFCGVIVDAVMSEYSQYPVLELQLKSTSYLLDREKCSRSFMITSMTYEQVIKTAAGGFADIQFEVTDKAIGSWILQNDETNWEFIKRMASHCNAVVIVDVTKPRPTLTIGISSVSYPGSLGKSGDGSYVTESETLLTRGELVTRTTGGTKDSFIQPTYYNAASEGLMMTGTVMEVQAEKVKVFLDSIDSEFDSSNDYWFEYATPFATNGGAYGSGFYWMPEEGDQVRVFMPTSEEAAAFAFGSVSVSALSNPVEARWRVPGGQEILFTEDGIRINCEDQSIYIDMNISSECGITVYSDRDITIEQAKTITINGKEKVTLYADNKVALYGSETSIELEEEKIVFQSEKLHIN